MPEYTPLLLLEAWGWNGIRPYLRIALLLRMAIIVSYSTSLKANRKAAVMALWVTLGPIPSSKG